MQEFYPQAFFVGLIVSKRKDFFERLNGSLFLVEHGARVNVAYVVKIFKRINEFLHLGGVFALEFDFVERLHRDFRGNRSETCSLECFGNGVESCRIAHHVDRAVIGIGDDVVGSGFKGYFHYGVFAGAGGKKEFAAVTELEGNRAFGTHVAAVFGQSVTHVGHGTGAVVGGAVDNQAGAADPVAFIADFFVVDAFELSGALQNGVLNRVLGNVTVTSLGNGQTQAGVHVGIAASGGRKLRTDAENLIIGEATSDKFLEYVDVEGVVQPILTIQINTREAGSVDRIIAEEGTMMNKGDTILTLNNPDLIRAIEDQQDEWEKQLISYQEKEIEMEQKSIDLQQKTLQTTYELNRLKKSYALDEEEFNMGVKSKAQLEVARDEFDYKTRSTALQLEGLRHDSAATILRRELMKNDLERERKKFERVRERMEDLVVRAPLSGQLSFVKVTPGQQVQSTEAIAEIKVLDQFKIHTSLSEYYIDRITTGLPATITWQNKKYPLRITKVVPEVKDRNFDVDLVFTEASPENVRIGKSFRVQIELGQPEEALVIPRGDFFQATGGQWIYKLNESGTKARKTPVSIGRQNPQQYEITGGLQPGDKVIVTGYSTFGDAEELILK